MKDVTRLFALLLVLVSACDDSDEDPPPTTARVSAVVTYGGSAEGALVLAAFPNMPPMGPPAGFAQQAAPMFPATLAIDDLALESVYVLALLDVAPASPQQPGPEDRTVWSGPIALTIGETASVELTLRDP